MANPSWLLLRDRIDALRLPADLAARDARGARDVGWAEQMLPFVEQFSAPGGVVLDPFAGLGTTLVAAAHLGRVPWGVEFDPARAALIRERLARQGDTNGAQVWAGDAASLPVERQSVDLVLTNVPYFEQSEGEAGQLYAAGDYETYLRRLPAFVDEMFRVLRPRGAVVAMAQNVTKHRRMIPQAWDWGRALQKRLVLREERVLLYPRDRPDGDDAFRTNRAHEYALVAQKRAAPTWADVQAVSATLRDAAVPHVVMGSWAQKWHDPASWPWAPHDTDVLMPHHPEALRAMLRALHEAGYALLSWEEPVTPDVPLEKLEGRFYVRAERDEHVVDVTYGCAPLPFEEAEADSVVVKGVPLVSLAHQARVAEAKARDAATDRNRRA